MPARIFISYRRDDAAADAGRLADHLSLRFGKDRVFLDVDAIDPLLTGVVLTRIPFGRSNYGAILSASTNGQVGVGISLMNVRLLPVLP